MFNRPVVFGYNLPEGGGALEAFIARREGRARLKPGTEAGIIWNDKKVKNCTPVSIVYLHGFSASHGDANPVHKTIARYFGCNLYLARLYGHGLQKSRPLGDLTPQKLWYSAQQALAIGKKIGERVVLMASSAGGLLALRLSASPRFASNIKALVLYSPLIHLYGKNSLLFEHTIMRRLLVGWVGRRYLVSNEPTGSEQEKNIWYPSYQLQGVLALGQMIQQWVKPSLFQKIDCPVFAGYYFKDKWEHDRVVSTGAIRRMIPMLGAPGGDICLQNFPKAGAHVLSCSLLSHAVDEIVTETENFLTFYLE